MRILFDNGVPRGLAKLLRGHLIEEAREHGWDELANGSLIQAAEDAGFDLLLTNDTEIRYQQNLSARKIAIVVLLSCQWPGVRLIAEEIASVNAAMPNSYMEIAVPRIRKQRH